MKRHYIITFLFLTILLSSNSQVFDTTKIRIDREAFLKGDLKRPEINLQDWTITGKKIIKLRKNTFNRTCCYNYKKFTFYFEFEPLIKTKVTNTNDLPILTRLRNADIKSDTINLNKYVEKARDENFMIEYLIKLTLENEITVYDSVENRLVDKAILKKATWETKTDKAEVTLFYFNNLYLFYRNDRICTSKRDLD